MKKILLIAAAIFMAGVAQAQKVMTITKTDGTKVEIATADVQDVQFLDPAQAPIYLGTWKVKAFADTPESYNATWGDMFTNMDQFPTQNDADRFTITEDKMTTSLKSTLGNYFQAESGLKAIDDYTIHTGIGQTVTLKMVELDNVNRYFSATEASTDKVAQVGFAVNDDDETLLDMYLIDFESKSFAPELGDYSMYYSTKPVATDAGTFIKLTLEKAE